jgi:hypothetical protein
VRAPDTMALFAIGRSHGAASCCLPDPLPGWAM